MDHISLTTLTIILVTLIVVSGFFSAAEIGMMAINRYRLQHLVTKKHRMAMLVSRLLERPDRLLGVILIGNTFANIMASAVATLIAANLFGEMGIAIATMLLTLTILVFSEVAPKTFAADHQQSVAFFCAFPLMFLLKLLYPVVWLVNTLANALLKLLPGNKKKTVAEHHLTPEELRSVVYEASGLMPHEHRDMLIRVLELQDVTVNDIMVPRHEIVGINLNDEWEEILLQLRSSSYTRLPIYRDHIDNVLGILHLRSAIGLAVLEHGSKEQLLQLAQPMYWIPEHTSLNKQLLNFRKNKYRMGLVVNEYGDVQGLVTVEDVLEEIVGEFTTDIASTKLVHPQIDGSFVVDGSATIRELNREMQWELPSEGPKTLSGLIVEYLESIPPAGVSVRIAGYPIEIVRVKDNMVKTARIFPEYRSVAEEDKSVS